MIKNYKTFDYIKSQDQTYGIGISSIYIPINEFINYYGFEEVVHEFKTQMQKHNLGIFIIITKEFKKVDGEEKLFKEIMLFAD